jgi:DNA-binding response OmpR family regulator
VYKIAVLDDDRAWNVAVKRFFTRHGFQVETYENPSDFLNEAQNYDLALIDFYLSSSPDAVNDLNGYAIIRHLKRILEVCPILVIVSAFVDMESARVFPEADFFLVKDIGLDSICQRAQELIESRKSQSIAKAV